jgi:AcrR family transcriptional regulator
MTRSRMQGMSPRTRTTTPAKAGTAKAAPAKRTYNSSRRKRQAAETRAEVLVTAARLFNESGWAGTTVATIAEEAGVAVETIYTGFGSKKALLRDAADTSVVGDADPIPFADRPEFRQFGEGATGDRIRAGMNVLADINERSAGVWRALQDAAEGDDAMTEWAKEAERRRRLDTRRSLERIFERSIEGPMVDALWVLYGPETYRTLVHDAGQSRLEYQRCIAEATLRILGEDLALLESVR